MKRKHLILALACLLDLFVSSRVVPNKDWIINDGSQRMIENVTNNMDANRLILILKFVSNQININQDY